MRGKCSSISVVPFCYFPNILTSFKQSAITVDSIILHSWCWCLETNLCQTKPDPTVLYFKLSPLNILCPKTYWIQKEHCLSLIKAILSKIIIPFPPWKVIINTISIYGQKKVKKKQLSTTGHYQEDLKLLPKKRTTSPLNNFSYCGEN